MMKNGVLQFLELIDSLGQSVGQLSPFISGPHRGSAVHTEFLVFGRAYATFARVFLLLSLQIFIFHFADYLVSVSTVNYRGKFD